MANWIEVKARYDRMMENGVSKKVTEPYLVDALSCSEAEARVIKELRPYVSGDLNVTSTTKTKIAEVFVQYKDCDKYYRVKVNFITLDEKTAAEKRNASYIIVPALDFRNALENFVDGMKGTMADFEIESIAETKIVEVYSYAEKHPSIFEMAERVAEDGKVQRAVKNLRDSVPDGVKLSVSSTGPDGKMTPEAVVVDKTKQRNDDD